MEEGGREGRERGRERKKGGRRDMGDEGEGGRRGSETVAKSLYQYIQILRVCVCVCLSVSDGSGMFVGRD